MRPAHYEAEKQELVDVLQTNLPYLSHARIFDWLYLNNPEGNALTWVAVDTSDNKIVGAAAAFPRRILCHGRDSVGYVLGDFCVEPGHRSLGLAVTLQRACLEGLSAANAGVAIDFPSHTMLAVYKRLRTEANLTMIRYAKPLRADRKVAEHVPVRALARGLSALANTGLRVRDRYTKEEGDWTIAAEPGPWGEEFTQAAYQWSPRVGICVARTAPYLNWRYREHPQRTYQLITARRASALCGYLILHVNGEHCSVDDLFAEDDTVRKVLLGEATSLARQLLADTLSVPWLATHPGRLLLEESGFRARESSPVVLLALSGSSEDQSGAAGDEWFLTQGDGES